MDTLTIKGVGKHVDGDYECDLAELLDVSSDEALTMAEARLIKVTANVRGNHIIEAFLAGDTDVSMALAEIIVGRSGKALAVSQLLGARVGAVRFTFGQEEAEAGVPPTIPAGRPSTVLPSMDGGDGGGETSDVSPAAVPGPTGLPG